MTPKRYKQLRVVEKNPGLLNPLLLSECLDAMTTAPKIVRETTGSSIIPGSVLEELAALKAERDWLRAGLKDILGHKNCDSKCPFGITEMFQICEQALTDPEPKP